MTIGLNFIIFVIQRKFHYGKTRKSGEGHKPEF
jgi:hypothetical protein